MLETTLYNADCLDAMKEIADGSVDMIAADLPYGMTDCKWDSVIPFAPLWEQYRRIIKPKGAIVLTASQPFTSALVMSNPAWFRYEWIWDKVNLFTNHSNAHKMPMRQHENVLIFYGQQPVFNRQFRAGKSYSGRGTGIVEVYTLARRNVGNKTGKATPSTLLSIPARTAEKIGLHPTQKPVALFEYLIRTYTNEGETVLDNTMGSGTTGVACVNTGRKFIGIEKDAGYFATGKARIEEARAKASGELALC